MRLVVDLLSSPAKAFQTIGEEKKTRGFMAMLIVWVLVIVLSMVTMPAAVEASLVLVEGEMQGTGIETASLFPVMLATTIIFAVIAIVVGVLVLACLYLFLAFLFRDRVEGTAIHFKKALQLAIIVNMPAQLGAAVYSIILYYIAIPAVPSVVLQYLNPFYLITFIWLFLAARYTMKLPQPKALAIVAVCVAIHVVFGAYQIYAAATYTAPVIEQEFEQSVKINI